MSRIIRGQHENFVTEEQMETHASAWENDAEEEIVRGQESGNAGG
jgi:hypothetical protein